mgnify:CR=1 FL=1
MLRAELCRQRRQRLWAILGSRISGEMLVLADPLHLRYFANFHVEPFHLGADFGGLLAIRRDGSATLVHDKRLPDSVQSAHAEEKIVIPWYDGQTPGQGARRLALYPALQGFGGRIHDALNDHFGPLLINAIGQMRRQKDPDELAALAACMRACEAGHAWARNNLRAGMTELTVYNGVFVACAEAVGKPAVVYGDFAVSPGPTRRGGPPTSQVLASGDMFILDYSVILGGYRSDFTNTLVVGGQPNPEQTRLYEACVQAMSAGERALRTGVTCQTVYDAVRQAFASQGLAEHFPHHAGHGLGLAHPEPPYIVRQSTETLQENDVVTLEPGLYIEGIGGLRIEHNYRILADGYERLSNHEIRLS